MFYNPHQTCQIKNLGQIYEKIFGCANTGTFVEVGAFDGEIFSNTSFLADLGWRGLYIEPFYESFKLCFNRHYYNNADVICCSIGTEVGEINFYQSFSHTIHTEEETRLSYLSTTNLNQTKMVPQIEWSNHFGFETHKVQQYTLEQVLTEHSIPKNFDILVVDVEGNEEDVLNSFSIDDWRPKMMIIEIEDENDNYQKFPDFIEKCKNLRMKILNCGYKEIYKDDVNTIFIDAGLDIPL
jgi:FkbM family methyltransferase